MSEAEGIDDKALGRGNEKKSEADFERAKARSVAHDPIAKRETSVCEERDSRQPERGATLSYDVRQQLRLFQ